MQFHLPEFSVLWIYSDKCAKLHVQLRGCFVYKSKNGKELTCSLKRGLQEGFILLSQILLFFFFLWKVCGTPALSKSNRAIFPITFAHFTSWCHLLVILSIFQTFSLLFYLLRWSEIRDLWCYCCNGFGVPGTAPLWNWTSWINVCVLTAPLTGCSSAVHLLLWLLSPRNSRSSRHSNMEIRPRNNPTMASRCSGERKSCLAFIFNQKLKVIKFSEEGTWEVETG